MNCEIASHTRVSRTLCELPPELQEQARKASRIWQDNPAHRGLHFKRVHDREPIYSVRIGLHWRAVGILDDDGTMNWFWIGSHADYDRLI